MNQSFYSFHGSPGGPEDFSLISGILEGHWTHQNRNKKENFNINDLESSMLIGYSWGCRELFRHISETSAKPKKIILISPYLFINPAGGKEKFIFSGSKLGRALYKKLSSKIVSDFLKKSSLPKEPSSSYLKMENSYCDYAVMSQAVLEKDEFELNGLANDLPIVVLFSEEDQTSNYEKQVRPLEEYFSNIQVKKIKNEGHASVWNSPGEVAELIKKYI